MTKQCRMPVIRHASLVVVGQFQSHLAAPVLDCNHWRLRNVREVLVAGPTVAVRTVRRRARPVSGVDLWRWTPVSGGEPSLPGGWRKLGCLWRYVARWPCIVLVEYATARRSIHGTALISWQQRLDTCPRPVGHLIPPPCRSSPRPAQNRYRTRPRPSTSRLPGLDQVCHRCSNQGPSFLKRALLLSRDRLHILHRPR